jgi:methionyl-tRNA formyltransferase
MTTKIDLGEVVQQYSFAIETGWGEEEINRKAFELAAEHIAEVLERVESMRNPDISTEPVQVASYFTFPTPDQRRELRQRRRRG